MIAEPYGSNRRTEAGEPSRAAGRDRASTDPEGRIHRAQVRWLPPFRCVPPLSRHPPLRPPPAARPAQTHAGMEASERTPTRPSTRRFILHRAAGRKNAVCPG